MKLYTAETADPAEIVGELLQGKGAVRISGLFSDKEVAEARAIIMTHSETS